MFPYFPQSSHHVFSAGEWLVRRSPHQPLRQHLLIIVLGTREASTRDDGGQLAVCEFKIPANVPPAEVCGLEEKIDSLHVLWF